MENSAARDLCIKNSDRVSVVSDFFEDTARSTLANRASLNAAPDSLKIPEWVPFRRFILSRFPPSFSSFTDTSDCPVSKIMILEHEVALSDSALSGLSF